MVKKKAGSKKKPSKKSKKNPSLKRHILRAVYGCFILAGIVIGLGVMAHFLIPGSGHNAALEPEPAAKTPASKPASEKKIPTYEVYPIKDIPAKKPPVKPPEFDPNDKRPMVALIIDDLGYDGPLADKFLGLDAEITLSILPYSPKQEQIARAAHQKGLEVMLHLPMEPREYPKIDPGPGALVSDMTPDQLVSRLERNLAQVPFVVGVNNHMGSRLTENSDQMNQIMIILKKRNLYFIDSRTTAGTLCRPSAKMFQVPFAERDVFLDHKQDAGFIRKQINQLIRDAEKHGEAVGIGHPSRVTYEVLKEMLPLLKKKVRLVPASKIVHPAG
ncbi:MAG: divergent polysaccharide deacetylase family protein [Desulfobacterales bacterium]|nr:divergent polysaccharide deacetylase family protein [Desulfobacterales bacterium]